MRRLIKRLFGSRSFKSSSRLPRVVEPLERRQLLSAAPKAAAAPPRYDHVVVVIEENHAYNQILGASEWPPLAFPTVVWPFLNQPLPMLLDPHIRGLASAGAIFTNSHGITHPSEPNYLAIFSGSTQGVTSDAVPRRPFTAPSLAGELLAAGDTFASYSQGLPHAGYHGGDTGNYVRHHAPWTQFADVPPATNLPFSSFPRNYDKLPTVSFVVPDLLHDMHSGTVAAADHWLHHNLGSYAHWARSHNSLLIVTWDENNGASGNQIPTFFVGAHVRTGKYNQSITHYNVLRTIEDMYGLPPLAKAAGAAPITNVFAG